LGAKVFKKQEFGRDYTDLLLAKAQRNKAFLLPIFFPQGRKGQKFFLLI
jgi:hypothetical protein